MEISIDGLELILMLKDFAVVVPNGNCIQKYQ